MPTYELTRPQWSDVAARFSGLGPVPFSVEHHTASPPAPSDIGGLIGLLRSMEHAELRLGYVALAYHTLVVSGGAYDGWRIESRPAWAQGGATLNHNSDSRAVCLIGNFEGLIPTDRALGAVATVLREWLAEGLVTGRPAPTWGHRDVFATACPGRHAYDRIPTVRDLVETGAPAPVSAPEEQWRTEDMATIVTTVEPEGHFLFTGNDWTSRRAYNPISKAEADWFAAFGRLPRIVRYRIQLDRILAGQNPGDPSKPLGP